MLDRRKYPRYSSIFSNLATSRRLTGKAAPAAVASLSLYHSLGRSCLEERKKNVIYFRPRSSYRFSSIYFSAAWENNYGIPFLTRRDGNLFISRLLCIASASLSARSFQLFAASFQRRMSLDTFRAGCFRKLDRLLTRSICIAASRRTRVFYGYSVCLKQSLSFHGIQSNAIGFLVYGDAFT